METYSSPRARASSSATSRARVRSRERVGSEPPVTRALLLRVPPGPLPDEGHGSAPSFWRTGTTIPSS